MKIIATLFYTGQTFGIWIIIMLCVYMACLAFSINAVIWVLIGEIFPTSIRGRAMTAFLFPWYVSEIRMSAGFFTFAGMCLLATLFFYEYLETKGKSLEEIEKCWKNNGMTGSRKL